MAFLMRKIKRSYDGVVVEVRDGDTIVADLDLTLGVFKREKLRLIGLDSPEKETPNGIAATRYLRELLPLGSKIVATLDGTMSFDRRMAQVRYGVLDLTESIIHAGHGLPWNGEGDHPYDASGNPRQVPPPEPRG